tara:strand:+ start:163 stop:432 length:270 start_codon:yes stop_codon:yes gene_type:complete
MKEKKMSYENDKNPVLSVVDGKICINDKTFEVTELRKSKEYLQSIGAEEAFFYPENDEELDEMHEIVTRMGEASPEASGENESLSYYLN